jgi:hypothetical protein
MARQEDMLRHRLTDLQTEQPVLAAFYNTLNEAQKTALLHPGPEAMMGRHRMFSEALMPPMPNAGMMDRGPDMQPYGPGTGQGGPPPP